MMVIDEDGRSCVFSVARRVAVSALSHKAILGRALIQPCLFPLLAIVNGREGRKLEATRLVDYVTVRLQQ